MTALSKPSLEHLQAASPARFCGWALPACNGMAAALAEFGRVQGAGARYGDRPPKRAIAVRSPASSASRVPDSGLVVGEPGRGYFANSLKLSR